MLKELYHYWLISRSGLFDSAYYLRTYQDVLDADVDPLMHFIKFGWQEGRNPSAEFITKLYLELHPDVESADLNPLVHYLKHGKTENCKTTLNHSENIRDDYLDISSMCSLVEPIPANLTVPPQTADIIIFPIIDWDFRFQRPQQLASQLAKRGQRVFYIKTGFCPDQAPQFKMLERNIFEVRLASGDREIQFYTSLANEDVAAIEESVRILKNVFSINSAIMIVDLPFWRRLAIRLKHLFDWKLIYDCMDLHPGFSISSELAATDEKALLRECDIVLATSHLLYEHVKEENDNVLLVPNGTDFDFFHQAVESHQIDALKGLPTPIIGYYGAIADWFDTHLIGELASRHPEWTFLLIGSTYLSDLKPLENLQNVHLLGEKPYRDIPAYLSHFDVCIIPFKQSPLTHATNPVKMYEYLSAGKPVVSTRLEEISHYEDYVRLADTTDTWEAAIQESLAEKQTPQLLGKRYAFARENTWEKRAEVVESAMNRLFPKISIIVITYNNLTYTQLCLESIINHTSHPNYEIIVVDNASNQETIEYLEQFQSAYHNTSLVLNDANLGFAKANNQGFQKSDGAYIVFLNNDTIVTPGWLHRLHAHLKKNPAAGMVGPVTNAIGNEAKIDVDYAEANPVEINAFAAQRAIEYAGQSFKIKVLALYCCMISRELFESVGGLDERYQVGMFEDDDLAMKIRQQGLDLICAEDVFIHHFLGASLKALSKGEYQHIFNHNKQRFEAKWGIQWEPHVYR